MFDIPSIQGEYAHFKSIVAESQKGLTDLYSMVKGFKDTSIGDLATNTEKLQTAIAGSAQTTAKAKAAFDDLTRRIQQQVTAANDNVAALGKGAQAYDVLIKQAVKNKIVLDDLAASQNQLRKAFEAGTIGLSEYENTLSDIRTAQQGLKTSNADVTKSINNMTKEAQASTGSLDQLRAKLLLLQQQYDKLSESEQNSEAGQGLLKTIQAIDAAAKAGEGKTGRFRLNVGNYESAFAALREEREKLKAELAAIDKSGPNVQNHGAIGFKTAAQRQQEGLSDQGPTNFDGGNAIGFDPARHREATTQLAALNVILDQQEKGFKNITTATRAAERALQTMAAAGLEGSEGFEKLRESTIEAAQAQKEFHRQQELLESEAPVLGAITLAAKGLAGAYAVGAGSVALFAEGNEKVEKELNKLVAIMTILQGLQEAYELINKSGAATQAIRNGLLKATSGLVKENAISTEAAAAANMELAASETEVVAAEEAQTVSATEAAAATEGLAVAEGLATAATVTFGRALAMTGIGALIVGVAVAIAYVISKIPDWIRGNDISIKQQGEIAEAVKRANDALIEQVKTLTDLDEVTKTYYEKQLALANAAGANEYKQFAIKKAINEEEKSLAQDQIDLLGANNEQQSKLKGTLDDLNLKRREAIRIQQELLAIPEQNLTGDQKDELAAAGKNIELYGKRIEAISGLYEAGAAARKRLFDANQREAEEEAALAKFNADEQRKLVLETGKLEVDAAKDRNAKILSDARSTYAQRLAAIKSDRDQELKAAQLERNSLDPNATLRETEIADAKLRAARDQANRDYEEKAREEQRRAYERDRDTRLDVYKSGLQQQVELEDEILNKKIGSQEGETSAEDQLNALKDRLSRQKLLVEANREEELDKEGLTNDEKNAIKKKANDVLNQLDVKYLDDFRSLNKKILDATLADWDQYYEDRKTQVQQDTNAQIDALNKRLEHNKISQEKYDDERRIIEDEKAEHEINLQVLNDRIKLASFKQGTKEYSDANQKLQDDLGAQSDDHLKTEQDKKDVAHKELVKTFTDIKEQADDYSSALVDVIDIGYNRQKVALDNLEVRQQRAYDQEKKNIEDTTGSEEQKAIRLKILDDQRQEQKEQNDRRQRKLDLDKAKFDKDKNILDIITGTAVAVVRALPNIPLAVAVGILGAAELAAAIAVPLPKYRRGTQDHPGGMAIVGDGGEKELILEPGRAPRWSAATPTIESLLPHTRVIPAHKIEEMTMSGLFVNRGGVLVDRSDDGVKKELKELKEAVIWQTQRLEQSAAKNRARIVNKITVSADWHTYIHNSVFK